MSSLRLAIRHREREGDRAPEGPDLQGSGRDSGRFGRAAGERIMYCESMRTGSAVADERVKFSAKRSRDRSTMAL
jgi:hypothetical protein